MNNQTNREGVINSLFLLILRNSRKVVRSTFKYIQQSNNTIYIYINIQYFSNINSINYKLFNTILESIPIQYSVSMQVPG